MGLFSNIFNKTHKGESVVLIDISAGSVAGAYAYYKKGENPSLLYTRRLPIVTIEGEQKDLAMLRALGLLGDTLIIDGAPVLARHTGNGRADTILVSVDAPWQETKIRKEFFERKDPFVLTKSMVDAALDRTSVASKGKVLADESVIGTILNGYETREPYGKKVRHASVIILTSLIDEKISKNIAGTLRGIFHTENILSIAGSSLRYQAMRTIFPHERGAIILDAIGQLISVALVHKDLLVAVVEMSDAVSTDINVWIQNVIDEFTELAKDHPLPRTIFLLAQEQDSSSLEHALNSAKLSGLWLSDNPPKIVPVRPSHISSLIRQVTTSIPDLSLLLMTLYWKHRTR